MYGNLPRYTGMRIYCDGCGKYFRENDMMAVWKDYTFCYPLGEAGARDCLQVWKRRHRTRLANLNIVIDDEEKDLMLYGNAETEGEEGEEGNFGARL